MKQVGVNHWNYDGRRQAAAAAGQKRFEGRTCIRGHTIRRTTTGACIACQNMRTNLYRQDPDVKATDALKAKWRKERQRQERNDDLAVQQ